MSQYYYYAPSLNEWDGYISGVFYLEGCNFKCHYCHNWRLVADKMVGEKFEMEEILQKFKSNLVDGIVITGGEPTLCRDKIEDIIQATSPYDVKIETNGSNPDVISPLLRKYPDRIRCVAIDVKAPLATEEYTYAANVIKVDVAKIKKTLEVVAKFGVRQEIHTTLSKDLMSNFEMKIIGRQINRINSNAVWYIQNCNNEDIFSPEICKRNYTLEEVKGFGLEDCFFGEIIYKGF